MKLTITLLTCLASLTSFGQSANVAYWNAPYTLAVPFGWRVERSTINNPRISFNGIEDIRYAPGWGNVKSEQYWSYGFLWYADGLVNASEQLIENNLNVYYTSLSEKYIDKQNSPVKKTFSVKTKLIKIANQSNDLNTYYGTIALTDYIDQQPMVLNCIVRVKTSEDQSKTFLFFEVSPQPLENKIWKSLDYLWLSFEDTSSLHKPRLTMNAYFHSEAAMGNLPGIVSTDWNGQTHSR